MKISLILHVVLFQTFAMLLTIRSEAQSSNAAIKSFEAFWKLFNKNYASFHEKGIDWQQTYNTFRPQITSTTTDHELFRVLTEMVRPLNDAHVGIKAKNIDTSFSASRISRIKNEISSLKNKRRRFREMTGETLKEYGFTSIDEIGPTFRDEKLFSYTQNGSIGYLRFMRSF